MERRTIAVLSVALLGLAMLMLVASSGVVAVWHDPPPGPSNNTVVVDDTATDAASDIGGFELPEVPPLKDNRFLDALVVATLVFFASLAAFVVWGWMHLLFSRREGNESGSMSFSSLPSLPAASVVLDTEAQLVALQQGTARNAIVACWMRLEDDVEAAGIARYPAETSVEFTTRVLAASAIDPSPVMSPVMELAALYREARFSRHQLVQADRDRALGALRRVHAALSAGAIEVRPT